MNINIRILILEFHYIKRGNGSYFIETRKYPVTKNNLIVIKTGEIHKFIPTKPYSYVEKGSLYFPPSLVGNNKKLGSIIRKFPHFLLLAEKEATLVEIVLKNIAEEIDGKENNWEDVVNSEIMLFLSITKRCASRKNTPVQRNPLTEKIIAHLEQNFTRDLSLSDIAEIFSLSASRISHIFKEETGLGLKRYIIQRRIVEAKKLLEENEDMKVKVISSRVGFDDFYLFNRSFKKITGLTPTNYRRTSRHGSH